MSNAAWLRANTEKEILAPFGYYGTCNLELFLKWVKEMLVPNLKENQIVIMDNASIYKSPKIKEAIEEAGCSLVYQPPYSPDLNQSNISGAI